ncbi:MAG: DUF4369 domain-containing protein [Bacteroidetes bacterium]|nr:DUF4369 domain-containing protein [Candidatus Colenecus caballi]
MHSFKQASVFAGICLMMAACSGRYRIEGTVDTIGYEGHMMKVMQFTESGAVTYDSCAVNHGKFLMKGRTDSTRFVVLCNDGRPVIPMYLEKGRSHIAIQRTEVNVSGTRQNDLFYSFLKDKNAIDSRYDELWQKRMSMIRSDVMDSQELDEVHDSLTALVSECEDMIYRFVSSNYNEQVSIGVFLMLCGSPANEMSPLVRRILDSAPDSFINSPVITRYASRVGYTR